VPATNPSFDSNPIPQTDKSWISNPIPPQDPTFNSNPVTWAPSPAHFGNVIGGGVLPTLPTPTFSPVAGTYTGARLVTIASSGADAIYYTTDGSTPTILSTLYTIYGVVVNTTETIKAIAIKAGYSNSAIGSAAYTVTPLGSNTIVRDNFVRGASAHLGANWTAESGAISGTEIGIKSSGVAAPDDNTANATSFYSAASFTGRQYAETYYQPISGIPVIGVSLEAVPGDTWYRACISNGGASWSIAKTVAGSYSTLASGSGLSVTSGSLIRAEAVPSGSASTTISLYVNGTLINAATDSSSPLISGSPGLAGYLTTAGMGPFEAGDWIWTRQGTVIPTGATNGTQEPSVIYEGNSVILYPGTPSTKVFKMWYTDGWLTPAPVINYAESTDGITWTEYSSNPVMSNGSTPVLHGSVFHFGNTYYAYESNGSPSTQLDQWTSPDGVNWTLSHANVLHAGTTGAWDVNGLYNPWVWQSGGTWYMLYEGENVSGIYSIGLATSPDGIVWTKDPANPVLTNGSGSVSGPTLYEFGGVYYLWTHTSATSNLPSDISLFSSTDLHTWTPSPNNPIYERVLANEGVNNANGQVADPMPIEVNGSVYLFYDATDAQSAGHIHINMATTPYTMLQTVLMLMSA
jgi:predicted GH43/DUF377 family glycosyl hydrolase